MLEILNFNTCPKLNLINATYPTAIQKIDSVALLRTFEPTFEKQVIFLVGHTIDGVGSGHYRADLQDNATPDNDDDVIVTIGSKRWKKIPSEATNAIVSDTTGINGSIAINNLIVVTQDQLDAITPIAGVLYGIRSGNYIERLYIISGDAEGIPTPVLSVSSITSNSVVLTLTMSNDSGIIDYIWERRTGTGGAWSVISDAISPTKNITVTGLAVATVYNFRVKAVNSTSQSAYSNIVSAETLDEVIESGFGSGFSNGFGINGGGTITTGFSNGFNNGFTQ
jgi:hypothetical protein